MRLCIVTLALILSLLPAASLAQAAPPCRFVLGFAVMHGLIPTLVGTCVDDEQHNPTNGDALQRTTNGLLVWRKLDNWTAFTDGYRTWVNGPYGLQERLNTQRFAWEANPDGLPPATSSPALQATYHICGPDAQTAQAIEQFIAGHNASASLVGQSNGCADLTITVSTDAGVSTGQSSSTETVDHISVRISTASGATHVTITAV